MLVNRRRPIGVTLLIGALWLLALAVAGAAGLEFLLKIRSRSQEEVRRLSTPRFDRLNEAYEPFGVQHLHPQYFFFFPLDPQERVAISNATCTVDADGFRGPGPAHAGGRQLAFLVGGSAAFGWYASSDATTIAGYLNRVQDRYFFVTAGVASWNSTQEMFRLAFQILEYRPALVMTYDGANDAAILAGYSEAGDLFPPGTPEYFDTLSALVDDRGGDDSGDEGVRWLTDLFPELTARIAARLDPEDLDERSTAVTLPETTLQAGAARYLSNLARMRDMTTAAGGRFVAVFQPVGPLHRNVGQTPPFDDRDHAALIRFHQAVMQQFSGGFEFHDLGRLFDRYYATVPVMDGDITDETVFVDEVHLYDPGNEVVARHLSGLLK